MRKPGFRTTEFLWGYLICSTTFTTNVDGFLTNLKVSLINSSLLVMKHKLYSLSLKMLYLYCLNAQKFSRNLYESTFSFWFPTSTLCTQAACDDVLQLCLCVIISKVHFTSSSYWECTIFLSSTLALQPTLNCTRLRYEIRRVCKLTESC